MSLRGSVNTLGLRPPEMSGGLDGPMENRRVHAPLDRVTARGFALPGVAFTPRCLTNPNLRILILNGRARPTRHL